jgi:hypothetical protein
MKKNKNENKFEKIFNSYEYAKSNEIDPLNPDTWDENYKNRWLELAGILPAIEEEVKNLKKIINEKEL